MLDAKDNPALILIDVQKGFEDIEYWGGGRNNPDAEEKMGQLLQLWRGKSLPIYHIQHCSVIPNSPLGLEYEGNQFQEVVTPLESEPIIQKSVNSGFIGTDLKERLEKEEIDTLVIVGLTTDHCVSTTTRMAGNLGFKTYLVSDATATFDKVGINGEKYGAEVIHLTALASLKDEFATVLNTNTIINTLR